MSNSLIHQLDQNVIVEKSSDTHSNSFHAEDPENLRDPEGTGHHGNLGHPEFSDRIALKSLVLECRDVHKEYVDADKRIQVLMGISVAIKKGEQIAVMGRSGSGKTTFLQMLGGLDKPTSGEVLINGQNIHQLSETKLEKIRNKSLGFIYQMHHLLPEFNAIENVAIPLLIAGVSPLEATERAITLLEAVGLKNRVKHKPSELSGGERQRVAIARALVNKPDCVLADEPTGNLDDENAEQVLEIMQSLNRQFSTSLVVVTHDPKLASKMDRTLVLHGGSIAE